MKQYLVTGMILSLLAVGAIAFSQRGDVADRDETIARGVEIKVEAFKARKEAECQEKALERAIYLADSLIRVQAYEWKIKHNVGGKPEKPDRPEFKTLRDSLRLDPLFEPDTTDQ